MLKSIHRNLLNTKLLVTTHFYHTSFQHGLVVFLETKCAERVFRNSGLLNKNV